MMKTTQYKIIVEPLKKEDGEGFIAYCEDLPGCMGDGNTRVEAIIDIEKAMKEWITGYTEMGRDIPKPGSKNEISYQNSQNIFS